MYLVLLTIKEMYRVLYRIRLQSQEKTCLRRVWRVAGEGTEVIAQTPRVLPSRVMYYETSLKKLDNLMPCINWTWLVSIGARLLGNTTNTKKKKQAQGDCGISNGLN